ncbi:MAG: hypothetical protein R3A79_06955 [Nannocystaceae bacterium]
MRCEPLDFPPGEGPFRARGTVLAGYMHYADARFPGGRAALRERLGDAALAAYFDRIFLAMSYYDLGPLLRAVEVLAREARAPLAAFIRERAQASAKADVSGIYARVLPSDSVAAMAEKLPWAFVRYFDGVDVEILASSAEAIDYRFSGLPTAMLGWYVWSNQGFVGESLRLAGAARARVENVAVVADGERDAIPLSAVVQRATWG